MTSPLRILFLVYNLINKGTYWRALNFAKELAQRGHTVKILVTSRASRTALVEHNDIYPNVSVIETPDLLGGSLRSGWDIWNVCSRIKWGVNQDFDIVHAFESRPTVLLPALYWKYVRKTILVMDWCDWFGKGGSVEERANETQKFFLRPIETFFEEKFRVCADGTTVINSILARKVTQLGVSSPQLLLPNGCDIKTFYPIPLLQARMQLGYKKDIPIIGYVGSVFPNDARLMAQSFNLVQQQLPDSRLLLIGYFNVDVEQWIDDPTAVERTGNISLREVNTYLSACNLGWLVLRDSGANRGRIPLKLNDYMSAGLPIIATKVGDIVNLVQNNKIGLLANDAPEDIANKTISLLKNPVLANTLGENGRYQAMQQTWGDVSLTLTAFYRTLREHRNT